MQLTRRLGYLLTLLAPVASATEFVGVTVPPYPEGLISKYGSCVALSLGVKRECDYAVSILERPDGKPVVLVGERLVKRDDRRKAIWIITDTLPYPTLPEGYLLAIANCRIDGKPDRTIIAAVRNEDGEWLGTLLWAHRFDLSKEKFVEQPTAGVQCQNEAAGL